MDASPDGVKARRTARGTRSSGLVAQWVGGVAALVLLVTALTGLSLGSYVARAHDLARARVTEALRGSLTARLEAQLALLEHEAGHDEDWNRLQNTLPARAAADPELVLLEVTDSEGLVLAASTPVDNGRALADPALRPLLTDGRETPVAMELRGRPALLLVRHLHAADDRVVWAAISTRTITEASGALHEESRAAVVHGWWVVGLGGFLMLVLAEGVVLLVGGGLARELRVVAWRVSELGRGDRTTHVRFDGPAELEHVGQELERAAQRLTEAAAKVEATLPVQSERLALDALHARFLPAQLTLGDLHVTRTGDVPQHACAFAARRAGAQTLFAFIEIVGNELDDALTVAELRALTLTSQAKDAPSLLADLEPHIGDRRARVVALAIGADAQIANAGGSFVVHRVGDLLRTIVVRGDRLGEPDGHRDAPKTVSLAPGSALILTDEKQSMQLIVERAATASS